MAALPGPVKALGLVSLLTDASSEMIYPLLPGFLTRVLGARAAFLGLVEGLAEATASLLKVAAGWASDRMPRRQPLVVGGYGLSSLARPLVALAAAPWHVLVVRLVDRAGKGVRSAPRDALLAEVAPPGARGRAFGFHRAMDHAGAVVGPLIASAVLLWRDELRLLFALSALPGAAAMAVLVFGVREPAAAAPSRAGQTGRRPPLSRALLLYLGVLAVFTLGNSTDAFLLLRAEEAGVPLAALPLLWTAHHAVKAAASTLGGTLADRSSRRAVILSGWTLYAACYAGFAAASRPWHVWALFAAYGLFHALTEGPERALVADLAAPAARGRAFGVYHALTGAMLLPASVLTGALWETRGPAAALLLGAGLAVVAALGLVTVVHEPPRRERAEPS